MIIGWTDDERGPWAIKNFEKPYRGAFDHASHAPQYLLIVIV